ncbi:MAG: hypothetical protein ACI9HK_002164 [Pirellulaceae bacterium]
MARQVDTQWFSDAIASASRTENFCVGGTLPIHDAGLTVSGVGEIALPLKPKVAKQLISVGKVAPYGKGAKTLVNKKVRNSFELDAKLLDFSDAWNRAVEVATRSVAKQLGLPEDQLHSKPYKLLLYELGGHFQPHRDSEKVGRMVGSLVIVLPTRFDGGELVVRHGSMTKSFDFADAAKEEKASFVAFYADCEHEVRRVTRGRRLAMTYNLSLKTTQKSTSKPIGNRNSGSESSPAIEALVTSFGSWFSARPGDPIILALEHHYTERGLKFDLLKGADRSLADLVLAATKQSNSRFYMAQVKRHLLQHADDGNYECSRWGYQEVDTADLYLGEVYKDDVSAEFWVDAQSKRQRFGALPIDSNAIISSIPIEDWKPASEDYEGYTGNAGQTLDRWYHRSAIVVWHEAHHFDVLARAGTEKSVELLCSMMKKLDKTPKKRLEPARQDCVRLTGAIIQKWPTRYEAHHNGDEPWLADFICRLQELCDLDLAKGFLSAVAHRDKCTSIDKLILSACHEHGIETVFDELVQLLRIEVNQHRPTIAFRDFKWLAKISCDLKLSKERKLLQKLCSIATDRFCASFVHEKSARLYRRVDTTVPSRAMPLLVKALLATKAKAPLKSLISTVLSSPDSFPLQSVQVPCLNTVVTWIEKQNDELPLPIREWLDAVRQELLSLTTIEPQPPATWTRPTTVPCNCRDCKELKEFLRNPHLETTRIAASQDRRRHLELQICDFRCDASHKLEKKGRPYSLVLKKNTASFQRAVEQYNTNVALLKSLPE